ncbi:U4/U5/U6 small nuclear ribonucleoprotein prp3 [Yarrowia sp. B02]|nr:U4/U5/U6 small nuclear ribonucleoprotein prp3 [Yarrowia sp. B02]
MTGRKHGLSPEDDKTVKRAKTDAGSIEAKRAAINERIAKLKEAQAAKEKKNDTKDSSNDKDPKDKKDQKSSVADRLARIKEKTAELQRKKLEKEKPKEPEKPKPAEKPKPKKPYVAPVIGLDQEVHPLLLQIREEQELKKNNPYLDTSAVSAKSDDFFDPNVDLPRARRPRALQFNEPGKYIAQAEELRYEAKMEAMRLRMEAEAEEKRKKREVGISVDERKYKVEAPPEVEWWDLPYVQTDEGFQGELKTDAELDQLVTRYIQHPVMIKAPWEAHLPQGPLPLHLTKREQKRIRKQARAEKHKDQQDRIRLGLDPAPPPKVKLTNLISVLSSDSIKDPTSVEMRVRREVEERRLQHEQDNQDRKLSKEERAQKIADKAERDKQTKGVFTAVFRIESLADDQHRYKVNVNARQLHLTGITLLNPDFNLVVVEGSPRDVLRYKKLMMRRIQWTEAAPIREQDEGVKEQPDLSRNKCSLVWEGQLLEQHFKKWTTESAEDQVSAVDLLKRNKVENYWIAAKGVN